MRLAEIAVKLSDDRWLQCSGSTRDEALEEWARFARQPPAPSSGYYIDDGELAYQLASYASSITLAR